MSRIDQALFENGIFNEFRVQQTLEILALVDDEYAYLFPQPTQSLTQTLRHILPAFPSLVLLVGYCQNLDLLVFSIATLHICKSILTKSKMPCLLF